MGKSFAAFNVDGLTIKRLFQLSVEHGSTPKFSPLSPANGKIVRGEMNITILIIIDEVTMILKVYLLHIHSRLIEIFKTFCIFCQGVSKVMHFILAYYCYVALNNDLLISKINKNNTKGNQIIGRSRAHQCRYASLYVNVKTVLI